MNNNLKVGIVGYGNLGRGVELAVKQNEDMELVSVFTRREPSSLKTVYGANVCACEDILDYKGKIDVLILCGGSATDLIAQTPEFSKNFNVVDSFDTHARIPEHFENVDKAAKDGGNVALISSGWDPGLFSMNRVMGESVLTEGNTYTFWGCGVSQGHSDALRRIDGVRYAAQYTVPIEKALESVRNGECPTFTTREKHKRECYVVIEQCADMDAIRQEIVTMPNYFADYDTEVYFITEKDFLENHTSMPHGGVVIRSGSTGENNSSKQTYEFSLKLDSNPEFTASMLVASARAVYKMFSDGACGAFTVLDIPISYFSKYSSEELRKNFL
ncbi:MAG: diaminopimelate dehydrogenase [Synergistaceae bacterium]